MNALEKVSSLLPVTYSKDGYSMEMDRETWEPGAETYWVTDGNNGELLNLAWFVLDRIARYGWTVNFSMERSRSGFEPIFTLSLVDGVWIKFDAQDKFTPEKMLSCVMDAYKAFIGPGASVEESL